MFFNLMQFLFKKKQFQSFSSYKTLNFILYLSLKSAYNYATVYFIIERIYTYFFLWFHLFPVIYKFIFFYNK